MANFVNLTHTNIEYTLTLILTMCVMTTDALEHF